MQYPNGDGQGKPNQQTSEQVFFNRQFHFFHSLAVASARPLQLLAAGVLGAGVLGAAAGAAGVLDDSVLEAAAGLTLSAPLALAVQHTLTSPLGRVAKCIHGSGQKVLLKLFIEFIKTTALFATFH
jgi:hypothetical protein